ncbi:helix-turn-helix domain-containing protein [Polymorphobacter multimanifer]|uniref:Transcriptional regulator with XRE-family HTH domain n=1 Tax=Polymorphobacter multimanifer TaxID=1070431 RepID=A0A841LC46_9SPHN|nr:helix-turn-helix transcriptional regulator [Polymorphobacter multimanifer]MBB6229271.1 transcriptional regulator with XRE-family HTH domain [Polymorphobacter multimanifer]
MTTSSETVGDLLRGWRQRRRFSQMDLAGDAEISTRHLSFVESGRASPSREMLLRLAEPLAIPLRERNRLLLAGGYAPAHDERPLDAADMVAARAAVEAVLEGHKPFPALAVDHHWNMVAANAALTALLSGVSPRLLVPPVNVLRLSLDPEGLAPLIVNLAEWRHHLLTRLRTEADASGDRALDALLVDLRALPFTAGGKSSRPVNRIAVPLVLSHPKTGETLSLLSTTTVFGTATDITLAELTLECFYPADDATRAILLGRTGEEI